MLKIWGYKNRIQTDINCSSLRPIIVALPPSCHTYYSKGTSLDILYTTLIPNFPKNLYHKALNELDTDHIPVQTTPSIQAEKSSNFQ